jgi:hypothetical protein
VGNPRRDGVGGRTEWARHGIRHRGRGVRARERALVRAIEEGEDGVLPHRSRRSGRRSWQIRFTAPDIEGWRTTMGRYRDLRAAREAAAALLRNGHRIWLDARPRPRVARLDELVEVYLFNRATGEMAGLRPGDGEQEIP